MKWTEPCPSEVGPIHWATVFWLLIAVLLCIAGPAIIEGWVW